MQTLKADNAIQKYAIKISLTNSIQVIVVSNFPVEKNFLSDYDYDFIFYFEVSNLKFIDLKHFRRALDALVSYAD